MPWTASTSPNRFCSASASMTAMRHPTVMLNVHRWGPDDCPPILCLHGVTGHSFGGLVATHLASAIGEHVGRVVLLDPAIEIEPEQALEAAEDSRNPPSWASLDEAKAARREQRTRAGYEGSDQDVDDHAQQ